MTAVPAAPVSAARDVPDTGRPSPGTGSTGDQPLSPRGYPATRPGGREGAKEAPAGRASCVRGSQVLASTRSCAPDRAANMIWRETLQRSSGWLVQGLRLRSHARRKLVLRMAQLILSQIFTAGIRCNLPRITVLIGLQVKISAW